MYIFIFRRDLRLVDNNGINYLIEKSIPILPIFIMDPKQIDRDINPYFSDRSVQFMHESLKDLDRELKKKSKLGLRIFEGVVYDVLTDIILKNQVDGICFNEDYTPYSKERDSSISKLCSLYNLECHIASDICLYDFKKINTKSGSPYKKFKWFYQTTKSMKVVKPLNNTQNMSIFDENIKSDYSSNLSKLSQKYKYSGNSIVFGGRNNGIKLMNKNIKLLKNYKAVRQIPLITNKPSSTLLSAYNKYGCISIRELYYQVNNLYGSDHEIIRQLVWRDFYYNLVFNYPETFLNNDHSYIKGFKWDNNQEYFEKWCNGLTGYPFIDASMRQLNTEGYMSNRGRLACASFLIRNLHIDWKLGEKYFANKLIDYDPSQNNGNWQWVSSSGYESQAYYRYINPEKDLIEFDPTCIYVKKYIGELIDTEYTKILEGQAHQVSSYTEPIVDIKDTIKSFKDKVLDLKK